MWGGVRVAREDGEELDWLGPGVGGESWLGAGVQRGEGSRGIDEGTGDGALICAGAPGRG